MVAPAMFTDEQVVQMSPEEVEVYEPFTRTDLVLQWHYRTVGDTINRLDTLNTSLEEELQNTKIKNIRLQERVTIAELAVRTLRQELLTLRGDTNDTNT